jgi:hypothetical protein
MQTGGEIGTCFSTDACMRLEVRIHSRVGHRSWRGGRTILRPMDYSLISAIRRVPPAIRSTRYFLGLKTIMRDVANCVKSRCFKHLTGNK